MRNKTSPPAPLLCKERGARKSGGEAVTTPWEQDTDNLVYSLYELTEEEIRIIKNQK